MAAIDKNGNIITGNAFQNPFKQVEDADSTGGLINPLHEKKRMLDVAHKMEKKPTDLLEKSSGKLLTDDGREIINEKN